MFNRKWSARGAVIVGAMMVAMLVTSFSPALAAGTTTTNGHAHANIGLRLRVDQDITAAVGQPLNFDVAAVNLGTSDATNVEVGLPLDLGNLKLTNAKFTDTLGGTAAFVTGIFTDPSINLLTAHYADTLAPGEIVTGTFTFIPQPRSLGLTINGTSSNTAIAYAIAIFTDADQGSVAISNLINTTIASSSKSSGTAGQVQMAFEAPYRKNPAHINIVAPYFSPGEKLGFWINVPGGGAADLGFIDYADATGTYTILNFDPQGAGLPAGTYSLVFHGYSSGVDFLAPFTVH